MLYNTAFLSMFKMVKTYNYWINDTHDYKM